MSQRPKSSDPFTRMKVFALGIWLVGCATLFWLHHEVSRQQKPLLDAQVPLARIAQSLLPGMRQRAQELAKSLRDAPAPNLTTQTIEYPFLIYWLDRTEETGPEYHGNGNSARVNFDERAPNFFANYDWIKDQPNVDVSRVKSIVIVLNDQEPAESKSYNMVPGNESFEASTFAQRVFVVDKDSQRVTGFRLVYPERLPPTIGIRTGGGSWGTLDEIRAGQDRETEAWLKSLPSTN